jgi:hypothetical protein
MDLILSALTPQKIVIKNKEEIIKELKLSLEKYNKVLTEETVKEGKEDKAKLNKVIKAIEDKRKEIKKAVMLPYEEVEEDFKEITNLINNTVSVLDTQIKAFEEEEKAKKQEQINVLLKANTTGVNLNNEKWLNATYKLKDIEQEINEFVTKFNQDMELLKDEDITIRDYYKRTLNISETLIEKKRIEELRKQEEQRTEEIKEEVKIEEPKTAETMVTLTLEFNITRTKAIKLKEFLLNNNIEYRKIGE